MAGLRASDDERGQILLVATLVLAASFVVLALVVNSAIFAENLATRNDVPGSHDALEHRADVQEGVGEIVTYFNTNLDTDHATLRDRVETRTATLSQQGGLTQAQQGRVVSVTYPGDAANTTTGARIAQTNASRNFTSIDGDSPDDEWTLASDIRQSRNVRFTFTNVSEDPNRRFTMNLDPGGFLIDLDFDAWRLSVKRQFATNGSALEEVTVTVQTPFGAFDTCTRTMPIDTPGATLTIDTVASTVNGEFCRALSRRTDGTEMWLGTGVSSAYDIEFEDGDAYNGTYEMVVDGPANNALLRDDRNSDEPYATDALYSVTAQYSYYTSSVGYETDIRVAPGEVPP
jgi:archaellin